MKSIKEMSAQELIKLTIAALNGGDSSSLEGAEECRKEAKRRGDKELINTLEYLWNVI